MTQVDTSIVLLLCYLLNAKKDRTMFLTRITKWKAPILS